MQLLYTWRNKTTTTGRNIQEINYSPEFNISFSEDELTINISKKSKAINIYKNDVIQNFNLIIGENGSGKTTLLHSLHSSEKITSPTELKDLYIFAYYLIKGGIECIFIKGNIKKPINISASEDLDVKIHCTHNNLTSYLQSSDLNAPCKYKNNLNIIIDSSSKKETPPFLSLSNIITSIYLSNSQLDTLPFLENYENTFIADQQVKSKKSLSTLTPASLDLTSNYFYFDESYPPRMMIQS